MNNKAAQAGGVGAALGVLVVLFMPEYLYTFTPETASIATIAFGQLFSYLVKFLPKPPKNGKKNNA